MKNCIICSADTPNAFNIGFKPVAICEECAASIFLQQATWYTQNPPVQPTLPDGAGLMKMRKEKRISLRNVENATGVSISTISRIENGKEAAYSSVKKLLEFYNRVRTWKGEIIISQE